MATTATTAAITRPQGLNIKPPTEAITDPILVTLVKKPPTAVTAAPITGLSPMNARIACAPAELD